MPFWRRGRDRDVDAGPHDDGAGPSERMQPPQPTEAVDLEEAMRQVAEQDTSENRRALFELLLASTLLAATAAQPTGATQGLAWLEDDAGPVLPVFTRPDALLAWRPHGYSPIAVTGRALFEMAARYKTARIEVNPASVPRGWISRAEIEALAQGRLPLGPTQEPASASEMQVAPPADRPSEELIEAARRALESQSQAVAGWLYETGPGQLMVGVQLARGLDQAATDETMQAIVEETWARSTEADRLRFTVVAQQALYDSLVGGAGELIFKR